MTGNLYNDITELLIAKTSLSDASIEIDYNVCRSYFLANHLPELKATIRSKAQEFNRGTEIIQNNLMDMKANKNCDFLLETSEEGKIKLDLLCEQQALKDGEIQLRSIIEHDESAKFADYKKIMKILYDRMFDNQTSILLQSK